MCLSAESPPKKFILPTTEEVKKKGKNSKKGKRTERKKNKNKNKKPVEVPLAVMQQTRRQQR